jgi:myo-inositol-1(or 4)-monophosphatase
MQKNFYQNTEIKKIMKISERAKKLLINLIKKRKGAGLIEFSKGGADFLTEADAAIDTLLIKELSKDFPNDSILTEESAGENMDEYKNFTGGRVWIIDPIDGTANFSRGNDNFAISIALVENSQPVIAIILMPQKNITIFAHRDMPKATINNRPIHVSKTEDLSKATIAFDFPWDSHKRRLTGDTINKLSPHIRQVKVMGSSVSDIARLAFGEIDGYIQPGVKPWDVAAVALVAEKSGATITTLDGNRWNIFTPDVLITNGKLHDKILNLIR